MLRAQVDRLCDDYAQRQHHLSQAQQNQLSRR
jgi:hypothetical protein